MKQSIFTGYWLLATGNSFVSFDKLLVLLRRVDAVRGPVDGQHIDRPAVLQGTKLLELFGQFQRRRRPGGKLQQELAAGTRKCPDANNTPRCRPRFASR